MILQTEPNFTRLHSTTFHTDLILAFIAFNILCLAHSFSSVTICQYNLPYVYTTYSEFWDLWDFVT